MLFWVEGFEVPTWGTYLEKKDSFMQEVPRYNPTVDAMKAPQLSCSTTLSISIADCCFSRVTTQ
jgi:hypothetical protein